MAAPKSSPRNLIVPALPGATDVSWAVFDADWYLSAYPAVSSQLDENTPAEVLYFYLERGRWQGHAPNAFFDEAWYAHAYADVALAMRRGEVTCGFAHYCESGFTNRDPHWLFDEALYRRNYPLLTDEVMESNGLANGFDHYVRHGDRESRIGHHLFLPDVYCRQLDPAALEEAGAIGPWRHYLRHAVGKPGEAATSYYFDPAWYLEKYPALAGEIEAGRWHGALHHYLTNDEPTAFDPLPEFSESYYLDRYPEVAAAVARGEFRNGYDHFLHEGASALNAPNAGLDLKYYAALPAVRGDLQLGRAADPFAHYKAIGQSLGLALVPPAAERIDSTQAATLFRRKAGNFLPISARSPLLFHCAEKPNLSAIVPILDHVDTTMMTLGSLRSADSGPIELILIDAAAEHQTRQVEQLVQGAQVVHIGTDVGVVRSRNAGLHFAAADVTLFLGSAVELAPGAVAAALKRLHSDATIGAVSGKLIAGDGTLLEAGGSIAGDGALCFPQAGASVMAPELNFVRQVDFCSSTFLAVRTALLQALEGFDAAFADERYVDADLCVRIAQAGFHVVYDPSVVIYDYAPEACGSAVTDADRELFADKHHNWLASRQESPKPAGSQSDTPHRVLFIESMIPSRSLGSGFVRSNDLLQAMAELGCGVTVFPLRETRRELASLYHDIPDTIELMHDRTIADLPQFLSDRLGDYDVIWVGRTHNFDDVVGALRSALGQAERRPRIVLDTEAIASVRDALRAALLGEEPFDLDAALSREFANAELCDSIVAVNPAECEQLRSLGHRNVSVIGHMREITPTPNPFTARQGMLFLGAIREMGSPNYDALCWFTDAVLPLVEAALGWETRLTVAGDLGPNVDLRRFHHHPRITLRGPVKDTPSLYNAHRLFVAPTRYAAGIPYKLHEAASFGLPIVATDLLAHQLGWDNGRELLTADCTDPVRFAELIVSLYRDEATWQSLRGNAIKRVYAENNREGYVDSVRRVLDGKSAPPLRLAASNKNVRARKEPGSQ